MKSFKTYILENKWHKYSDKFGIEYSYVIKKPLDAVLYISIDSGSYASVNFATRTEIGRADIIKGASLFRVIEKLIKDKIQELRKTYPELNIINFSASNRALNPLYKRFATKLSKELKGKLYSTDHSYEIHL